MQTHRDCREWSPVGDAMKAFEISPRLNSLAVAGEDSPDTKDSHESLEDAARDEQEYLRGRLRDELKREPSEEEMNEWLRQHTEGY